MMKELKRSHLIALVALAAIAVYANSLWNGFAYDDAPIIRDNPRVHNLRALGQIWLTPYWPNFGTQLGLYRPFAIFAYAVQWAIAGNAPWFFHLVNVLLHALVSVLVFLLAERVLSRTAAIAAGIVFAIHPLHTEAVANVVGQNELWAAAGVLAACLIYVRRPEGAGISWQRALGILALYALALLAKESAVVLPGLLVLLDVVQKRVRLERTSVLNYLHRASVFLLSFVVLLGGYLVLRYNVLGGTLTGTDAAPGLPHLAEQYRVLNAFRAWPEYMRLLFVPLDLSVDYSPGTILPAESFTPMVILGAALVLLLAALTLATPVAPRAGLVAGWFLISILPVSNLFFPIGVLLAERTLYLPSVAVCLLAGIAWDAARQHAEVQTRQLAAAFAVVVIAVFSVRTVTRNPVWDSLQTVWDSLKRDHPESYRSQWLNASDMWVRGRPDLAERYFEIAYRIWPRDSQMLMEWGAFYISQAKWDTAIALLEKSRAMTPFAPRTHHYLVQAYLYSGRSEDALRLAKQVDKVEGADIVLNKTMMATAFERLGQWDSAAVIWTEISQRKTGANWLTWAFLARAHARTGNIEEAHAAAQMAREAAGSNKVAGEVLQKFEQALATSCYKDPVPGCDPLEGWAVAQTPKPDM